MSIVLLVVVPVVIMICFCLVLKWTGTSILPHGFLMTPRSGVSFKFPELARVPGRGWVPREDLKDSNQSRKSKADVWNYD